MNIQHWGSETTAIEIGHLECGDVFLYRKDCLGSYWMRCFDVLRPATPPGLNCVNLATGEICQLDCSDLVKKVPHILKVGDPE